MGKTNLRVTVGSLALTAASIKEASTRGSKIPITVQLCLTAPVIPSEQPVWSYKCLLPASYVPNKTVNDGGESEVGVGGGGSA